MFNSEQAGRTPHRDSLIPANLGSDEGFCLFFRREFPKIFVHLILGSL